MALEKSVLKGDALKELVRVHYGLEVDHAVSIGNASANCFCIDCGDKRYFLKEFQSSFCAQDVEREAALTNYLAMHGFPTARFIATQNGEWLVSRHGHQICLEEYITGKTYENEEFPSVYLPQAAKLLARLHCVMRGYDVPLGMDAKWVNSFSADALAAHYEELRQIAKRNVNDPNTQRIAEDLAYKRELAKRCEKYQRYYDGVTYAATHGDYTSSQFLCDEKGIKAVIDFSAAQVLPLCWEILRSCLQSSARCRITGEVDINEVCAYVRVYMEHAMLTRTDLEAMPYVYLFQLARSDYGYLQYLTTDTDSAKMLLDFAIWRTQICREMEAKAEEMSKALLQLAK